MTSWACAGHTLTVAGHAIDYLAAMTKSCYDADKGIITCCVTVLMQDT